MDIKILFDAVKILFMMLLVLLMWLAERIPLVIIIIGLIVILIIVQVVITRKSKGKAALVFPIITFAISLYPLALLLVLNLIRWKFGKTGTIEYIPILIQVGIYIEQLPAFMIIVNVFTVVFLGIYYIFRPKNKEKNNEK
ncbi:MAG: hypothetical protein E7254_10115 [Lachnospiraceae bacterium]|nr:hypothetical protein [Lachnospiraceae bacterium]